MPGRLIAGVFVVALGLSSSLASAQQPPRSQPPRTTPPATTAPAPATNGGAEIKLDEGTTLRAAAMEARMSAIVANFALLQRQAQDLQQEMAKILEERKKLIEDAGKKANVDVGDSNEWAFDNKGQRYVHARRGTPPAR
jgi:hypothetical protein